MHIPDSFARSDAYRLGALSLLITIGVIGTALAFQYLGGLEPCHLCLMERYAYYFSIPVLFLALTALTTRHRGWAAAGFFLVSLAFLANAVLGSYHTGAEWGFWPGPTTCSGGALQPLGSPADLLKGKTITVIRCDQASWWFLGLSFAAWNVVVSIVLWITSFMSGRMALAQQGLDRSNLSN